jgi:hypothetical protein
MMMAQGYLQGRVITISRCISHKGCEQNETAVYHMTGGIIDIFSSNMGVILDAV